MSTSFPDLTERQLDLVRRISLGELAKSIAQSRGQSWKEHDQEKAELFSLLGLRNSVQLLLKAIVHGVISVDDIPVVSSVSVDDMRGTRRTLLMLEVAKGKSYDEIASALNMSRKYVQRHRDTVLCILKTAGNLSIAQYVIKNGLLTFEEISRAAGHSICPDCKGSGVYIGLMQTEPCQACGGNGAHLDAA